MTETSRGSSTGAADAEAPDVVGPDAGAQPSWFTAALERPPEKDRIEVAGCPIAVQRWTGPEGAPPLVLVHGGAANAAWWRALAPMLAEDRTVVAMDLSGHGDSGWRSHYTFTGWAQELLAVGRAAGDRPAVLCGHSMGGIVAAVAAGLPGAEARSVITVDTPLAGPTQSRIVRAERTFARPKRYPDEATARARFRLLPRQPVAHPALLEDVAARSVRASDDGWTWRFDPAAFAAPPPGRPADLGDTFAGLEVPVWTIVGGASLTVPVEDRQRLHARADAVAGDGHLEIAGGHHHLMFDQPLALLQALRQALAATAGRTGEISTTTGR